MAELKAQKALAEPSEIFFVADAMTGQDAVLSASAFQEQIGITGYEKALADPSLAEFHELLGFLRDRGGKHHARLQALRDHILEAPTRPMTAW